MRLSDIFKKTSGQQQIPPPPAPAEKPKEPVPVRPVAHPVPAQPEPPAPVAAPSVFKDEKPQFSAEQVYTEAVLEIKNILSALEQDKTCASQISCIPQLVTLLETKPGDLLLYADRATPDVYLYGHCVNVCIFSVLLAQSLGIDRNKRVILGYCSFLHDIGMAKVMDVALKSGKLVPAEQSQIRKHISFGQELLRNFSGLNAEMQTVIEKVLGQTHERIDGSGYPFGLKGSEIHEFARIIAIADVYEAFTHPRSYRTRLIPHEAVKAIINAADTEFDNQMVKAFVENVSLYPVGSYVRLNSEEIARVTGTKRGLPTRPTVQIIINPKGEKAAAPKTIDLSSTPMVFVKEAVDETKLSLTDKKLSLDLKAMRWWVKGF